MQRTPSKKPKEEPDLAVPQKCVALIARNPLKVDAAVRHRQVLSVWTARRRSGDPGLLYLPACAGAQRHRSGLAPQKGSPGSGAGGGRAGGRGGGPGSRGLRFVDALYSGTQAVRAFREMQPVGTPPRWRNIVEELVG